MKTNEKLRDEIFEVIENQIKDNNPPETKLTYIRLIESGYNEFETKQLIGQCVAIELFNIFKHNQVFDKERYIQNLKQLPKEPSD